MRCSLLTLSSYLDRELPPERSGELEAHLIACTRCSTGLGYLREEAERIRGLSAARVPVEATERLLVTVGLVADRAPSVPAMRFDDETPHEYFEPAAPPDVGYGAEPRFDFSPGLIGSAYSAPAPESAAAAVNDIVEESDIEMYETPPLDLIEDEPAAIDEPAPVMEEEFVQHHGADVVEVAGTRNLWGALPRPIAEETPTEVSANAEPPSVAPSMEPAFATPATEHPMATPPIEQPAMAPPAPGAKIALPPSLLDRIRDTVAVRIALMRTSHVDDLDENVQIVSGSGAPDWTAHPGQRDRHERMATGHRAATPPMDPPHARSSTAMIPPPEVDIEPEVSAVPAEMAPEVPGRHRRALHDGRPRTPNHVFADPRLGAFGAVVVLLLVIGLVAGKHSTPLVGNPARAIPNPTAIANAPPTVVATPAATLPPRPTPVPTASPLLLTGAQTLGSGATGFDIRGIRYGAHPNDFRIVFDLTGASSGAPKMIAGFGNPTTLYVEFAGAAAGGAVTAPASGSVVTSARILQPSPIAGHTIYEFTLARAVHLSSFYLSGPVRLVLDLR